MTKKTKIRHRNGINKTFASMPLAARRILFLIMSQIDPKHLIKEGQIFEVSAKDYSRVCNIDIDTAYEQLKNGARLLHKQSMEIPQEELLKAFARRPSEFLESEKNWRGMRLLHITDSCSYIDMEAVVQIRFSRQMEPYICMIEKDFTTQILLSSVRISDTNASNLYQLLRKNISSGKKKYFETSIDNLKIELGVEKVKTYNEFKYFKSKFIERSIKKIIDITEFKKIKMEISERKGKKAHKVIISYEYDEILTDTNSPEMAAQREALAREFVQQQVTAKIDNAYQESQQVLQAKQSSNLPDRPSDDIKSTFSKQAEHVMQRTKDADINANVSQDVKEKLTHNQQKIKESLYPFAVC